LTRAPLLAALRQLPALAALESAALEPLPQKGVAHHHERLKGYGLVLRVPRWSQSGLKPAALLAQEAAAFRAAEPSGHTPALAAVLAPRDGLPMGALVVREVVGRPPRLPQDLPALAQALAALHRLPLPAPTERAPLADPAEPAAALLAQVERQAAWFDQTALPAAVRQTLAQQLAQSQHELRQPGRPPAPKTLIGVDTHPGNFLIDATGRAWFLDLEKAHYSTPAIDLAHTSLYTSTTWDAACAAVLAPEAVAAFHQAWAAAVPPGLAQAVRPWRAPLRRLTWLRSLTWMARWREAGPTLGAGLPLERQRHFQRCTDDFFQPATLARVAAEIERLG